MRLDDGWTREPLGLLSPQLFREDVKGVFVSDLDGPVLYYHSLVRQCTAEIKNQCYVLRPYATSFGIHSAPPFSGLPSAAEGPAAHRKNFDRNNGILALVSKRHTSGRDPENPTYYRQIINMTGTDGAGNCVERKHISKKGLYLLDTIYEFTSFSAVGKRDIIQLRLRLYHLLKVYNFLNSALKCLC